jgi:hypothetical protein
MPSAGKNCYTYGHTQAENYPKHPLQSKHLPISNQSQKEKTPNRLTPIFVIVTINQSVNQLSFHSPSSLSNLALNFSDHLLDLLLLCPLTASRTTSLGGSSPGLASRVFFLFLLVLRSVAGSGEASVDFFAL